LLTRISLNPWREDWVYPAVLILAGFVYYISYFNYGISLSDEGFFVYGAERVLRGELPMSDFVSYPPGSYLLLALLFKTFGINLLVSRLMEITFLLLNGIMVFYIGRRLMPRNMALIPSFLLIAFPGPWHKVFFTFGLLLPLVTFFRFLEKRTTHRILTVGGAVGAALILKLEPAFYSFCAILIILFWIHTWKNGKFLVDRKAVAGFSRNVVLCSLGAIAVVTPVLVYYLWKSSFIKLFSEIREIYGISGLEALSEYFRQPSLISAMTEFHLGNLANLFFFLILFLYLYLSIKVFVGLFIRKQEGLLPSLLLLLFGIFSLSYAYAAFGKSHLLQSVAVTYILFCYVMHRLLEKKGTKSKIAFVVLVLFLGLYVADSFKWNLYFYSGSISTLYNIKKGGAKQISSDRAKVYVKSRHWYAIEGLLQFFQGKDGYLMSLGFDPMINFLTGLENPTRFSLLHPAFLSDERKQRRVTEEVERYKVGYLLINRSYRRAEEGIDSYAPKLYEYLTENYRLQKEIAGYMIFSRRAM